MGCGQFEPLQRLMPMCVWWLAIKYLIALLPQFLVPQALRRCRRSKPTNEFIRFGKLILRKQDLYAMWLHVVLMLVVGVADPAILTLFVIMLYVFMLIGRTDRLRQPP